MLTMRPATGTPSMVSASSHDSIVGGTNGALSTVTDAMYDSAVDCAICEKKFHAFRRKHRCRSCGNAVCGSCARNHKIMPSNTLIRFNNEPVRVCDRCIQSQAQMMQERRRMEDIERARARQQAALQEERIARMLELSRAEQIVAEQRAAEQRARTEHLRSQELKHLGPRPDRASIHRRRSMDDSALVSEAMATPLKTSPKDLDVFITDAEKRALEILDMANIKPAAIEPTKTPQMATMAPTMVQEAMVVPEADECAICLDAMDVGDAIYTTACRHSFHWRCLKEIQKSDASNADKCPSCRSIMEEMQVKKVCDHPRVRLGHRFCRDCGSAVTERDAKARPSDDAPAPSGQQGVGGPSQPTSYRAGSHGALVRCPQCQIQMRVLPHMYNMRVACPSGHMFLVQVAGQTPANPSLFGSRAPPRGAGIGYPGTSFYQRPTTYSGL